MAEEWGPWMVHDGGPCPLPVGTMVRGQFRNGQVMDWRAQTVRIAPPMPRGKIDLWHWAGRRATVCDVMRYRVRRPDALRRLIDLAADPSKGLPAPARELVPELVEVGE